MSRPCRFVSAQYRALNFLPSLLLCASIAQAGVEFCTGLDAEVSLRFYGGQSGTIEKYRFITGQTVDTDFSILEHGNTSWHLDVDLAIGMGESVAANMPFSPIDFRSRFSIYAETARAPLVWRAGWNHGCDHFIYKDDPDPWYLLPGTGIEPDVYYNRVFLTAGTAAMRPQTRFDSWHGTHDPLTIADRLILAVELGYYAQSIPGLFSASEVSGGHDWQWDLLLNTGYPLIMGAHYSVTLINQVTLLVEDDTDMFWRDRLELELYIRLGNYGGSLFAAVNPVDEHPRDSIEGLWELGARWVY